MELKYKLHYRLIKVLNRESWLLGCFHFCPKEGYRATFGKILSAPCLWALSINPFFHYLSLD